MATVGAAVTSRCGRSAAANCAWGLRLLGLQKERRLRGAAGGVAVVAGRGRRRLEPAIAGGPAGLARGRLGLRKIGFRGCKGANKTLYGCSDWA